VENPYILYSRSQGDVIDDRLQTMNKLITIITRHLSEIKEEIWMYDRGYWRKNHKLRMNVQGCKWDNVILNNEMKLQLVSDIDDFFDRKKNYESFAVLWKVSDYGISLPHPSCMPSKSMVQRTLTVFTLHSLNLLS